MDIKVTNNEIPKENIIFRKQVSIIDGELEILEEE